MATHSETVTTYDAQGKVVETRTVTWETTPEQDNEATLRAQVASALAANATFLALANPTNAQTLAQVQRLTRETSALIRLVVNQLDSTDGT